KAGYYPLLLYGHYKKSLFQMQLLHLKNQLPNCCDLILAASTASRIFLLTHHFSKCFTASSVVPPLEATLSIHSCVDIELLEYKCTAPKKVCFTNNSASGSVNPILSAAAIIDCIK